MRERRKEGRIEREERKGGLRERRKEGRNEREKKGRED